MRVLVIGSGGREHALVRTLRNSPRLSSLLCAPGNAGIAREAECLPLEAGDVEGIVRAARDHAVDLVVPGPEQPLVGGVVNALEQAGIRAFGPCAAAAQLEGSKSFAKEIMVQAGVPTARAVACENAESARAAIAQFERRGQNVVVKADGLAAGKGVTVTDSAEQAVAAVDRAMEEKAFGKAGDRVVIEERLVGEEASILALVDGTTFRCLVASQDHKPIGEGDTGPNTGGMGAYAPAPVVTAELQGLIERRVLEPMVRTMRDRETPYRGVLYAGLMIVDNEPYVIEFNCRFGDPETQVVLPMLDGDLLELLLAACDGTLARHEVRTRAGAATCVVVASGGYPGSYQTGKPIAGLAEAEAEEGVFVFHAGTVERGGEVLTAGGRVLGVTALGESIPDSIARAYRAVDRIRFEGAYCRRDIGYRALQRAHRSNP